MSRVEAIEREIEQLSPEEFNQVYSWIAEFNQQRWDEQFEADVKAGKLDGLAEQALRDHAAGRSTKL